MTSQVQQRGRHLRAVAIGVALAALASQAVAGVSAAADSSAPASGTLQAWGHGNSGQLGVGTTGSSDAPVTVKLPAGVAITKVAAGGRHTLAVTSTGQVLSWGYNFHGQLGDGNNAESRLPVTVPLPSGTVVTAVAAGDIDSLAVTSTGLLYSWGANQYGQLGDASTQPSNVPVRVKFAKGTKIVAAGTSYNYAMALTSGGQVYTWGYNGSGQLGTGFYTASEIPQLVKLPHGTKVVKIANGGYDGLALTAGGKLWAWGDDAFGQLGNGNFKTSLQPVRVKIPAGVTIVSIGAGSEHGIALTSTGAALTWGRGTWGQLGNGAKANHDLPVQVRLPARDKVIAVSAGGGFSVALTSTGKVLAWGHNTYGQLGDGSMADSTLPKQVRLPAGLIAVGLSAGPTTRHSFAIVKPAAG
jgi:alpha-tubulin suppressor-like RCC1 family protein